MGFVSSTETTREETARLERLASYAIIGSPRDPMFDRFVFTAAQLFRAPIALMTLVDDKRQWAKSRVGIQGDDMPLSISFCAYTIQSDDVMVVEDATRDARFADNPAVNGEQHIRFYAGAPLVTADGFRLGALCVMDRQPRTLHLRQTWQLAQLARSVVEVLETRRPTPE